LVASSVDEEALHAMTDPSPDVEPLTEAQAIAKQLPEGSKIGVQVVPGNPFDLVVRPEKDAGDVAMVAVCLIAPAGISCGIAFEASAASVGRIIAGTVGVSLSMLALHALLVAITSRPVIQCARSSIVSRWTPMRWWKRRVTLSQLGDLHVSMYRTGEESSPGTYPCFLLEAVSHGGGKLALICSTDGSAVCIVEKLMLMWLEARGWQASASARDPRLAKRREWRRVGVLLLGTGALVIAGGLVLMGLIGFDAPLVVMTGIGSVAALGGAVVLLRTGS
jgi:hypothetical protein